jgi:hypothetical protein
LRITFNRDATIRGSPFLMMETFISSPAPICLLAQAIRFLIIAILPVIDWRLIPRRLRDHRLALSQRHSSRVSIGSITGDHAALVGEAIRVSTSVPVPDLTTLA